MDFTDVSTSHKYWQKIIDRYYGKYQGVYKWHTSMIQEAGRTGWLASKFGREYQFERYRDKRGELKLPETQIKNYLTQGLGADIMAVARVSTMRRWRAEKIEGVLCNTVHDSLVADVRKEEMARASNLIYGVFKDLPKNISKMYQVDWDLEVRVEIKVGKDQYNLSPME